MMLVSMGVAHAASNLVSFDDYLRAIEHGQLYCAKALTAQGDKLVQNEFRYAISLCRVGIETPALLENAKALQKAAKAGDAKAQYQLGVAYLYGLGVKAQPVLAVDEFQKAAKAGNAAAQVAYGQVYVASHAHPKTRKHEKKQWHLAMQHWYALAAKQGDATGQLYYGLSYVDDPVLPRDNKKAKVWFTKAMQQGSGDARYELANLYYFGSGVPQDFAKAKSMYKAVVEDKKVSMFSKQWALVRLGNMYEFGEGVTKDATRAKTYYHKAALMGMRLARIAEEKGKNPQKAP